MNYNTPIILVAEDDPDDQELIAFAFNKLSGNFTLKVVNDGNEAIAYLESSHQLPCLIVLDYNMPELNGAQVIQKLTADKRFQQIPKVILSTSSNPVYIADSMDKGARAYIVKPHSFQQLLTVAEEILQMCNAA